MNNHDVIHPVGYVFGEAQGFYVPDGISSHKLWLQATPLVRNAILFDWGPIVQKLLRNVQDNKNYWIGGMYIEFDNSGSPVNPTPTIDRDAGLSYYNSLSSPRDYLRVPIAATEEASSDEVSFPDNNIAQWYAQTAGTLGVHGLTYSDSVNSRVYGGALVAFRDPDDASQDLIFSRFYFAAANQLLKVVGSQIGLLRKATFG